MKSNIPPLQPDTFYHIYNRGINSENIFKAPENYPYFLGKYSKFIPLIADTYAYCLLKNHFHLLIKTRSEAEIQRSCLRASEKTSSALVSLQFSHLFNSYAQAINKTYKRTGALFETPFRRKEITEESYLAQLLFYIHFNPEKHRLCSDFTKYAHSSYRSFITVQASNLKRDEVLSWFGGKTAFINFHAEMKSLNKGFSEFE